MADLFADDDGHDKQQSQTDEPDTSWKVNKTFARDYEARKQRQELQSVRFDDDNGSSSSSSDEDDDAHLLTDTVDLKVFETIHAIRNKDPKIYNQELKYFPETMDEPNDEEDETAPRSLIAKQTYKDVVRQQILDQMNSDSENEHDNNDDNDKPQLSKLSYNEQQQQARQAFLESTQQRQGDSDDDDSDDEFLVRKTPNANHVATAKNSATSSSATLRESIQKLKAASKNEYIDPKGEIQDGTAFLCDFFANRPWKRTASLAQQESDDDDDEASLNDLDQTDDFEAAYNFRFEQQAASATSGADHSLMRYSRDGVASLRRPDTTRREKRAHRMERKAKERQKKEQQLARLKAAKRRELENKLQEIKTVLGNDLEGVDQEAVLKLLEGDFDPAQFERLMQQTYNDSDYYNVPDSEWTNDDAVRRSLAQSGEVEAMDDDPQGGLYDIEQDKESDGDDEKERGYDEEEDEWVEEEEEEEEYNHEAPDGAAHEQSQTEQQVRAKMEEELYKLDYEDIVGGMPTRFKYKKVQPNNYGLSPEEILLARDTTLKQFVSLKKMAPYAEQEYSVNSKKRRRFRERVKLDMEEERAKIEEERQSKEQQDEGEAPTKKKRRRRLKKGSKRDNDKAESEEGRAASTANSTNVIATKTTPVDDQSPPSTTANDKNKQGNEKESTRDVSAPKGVSPKKKRKSKKKRRNQLEGVSQSRLASYGL